MIVGRDSAHLAHAQAALIGPPWGEAHAVARRQATRHCICGARTGGQGQRAWRVPAREGGGGEGFGGTRRTAWCSEARRRARGGTMRIAVSAAGQSRRAHARGRRRGWRFGSQGRASDPRGGRQPTTTFPPCSSTGGQGTRDAPRGCCVSCRHGLPSPSTGPRTHTHAPWPPGVKGHAAAVVRYCRRLKALGREMGVGVRVGGSSSAAAEGPARRL